MYTLHRLIVWMLILISPARLVAALPVSTVAAQANLATPAPYHVNLDTSHATAITVEAPAQPNFDTEVLAPLAEAQAQADADAKAQAEAEATALAEAAKAKAKAAAQVSVVTDGSVSDENLAKLRYCEAGGDYTRNSGNGYYGAYQYSISTWGNYGGYARADLAPAAVQDARVRAHVAARGWGAWPACAKRLGLY